MYYESVIYYKNVTKQQSYVYAKIFLLSPVREMQGKGLYSCGIILWGS